MKKQVCINDYLIAHGKAPRGNGFWWFYFDDIDDPWFASDENKSEIIITPEGGLKTRGTPMPFSKALKLAKQEAARRNAHVITVAP